MISLTHVVLYPFHFYYMNVAKKVPNAFCSFLWGDYIGQVSAESESAEDIGHDATVDEEDEEEEDEVLVEEDQIVHQVCFIWSKQEPMKALQIFVLQTNAPWYQNGSLWAN